MRLIIASAALLIFLASAQAGLAEQPAPPPTFKEATADYQAGKYQKALISFERFREKNPSNVLVHYYEALCYQGLNSLPEARDEFQYVADHDTGDLKIKAQAGLKRLATAKTAPSNSSNYKGGPARTREMYEGPPREGHLYNIVMYEDVKRCPICKKFDAAFYKVCQLRPQMPLTSIDIETEDASMTFYHTQRRHPFIVLLDGVGKVLWSGMAPMEPKEIIRLLDNYK